MRRMLHNVAERQRRAMVGLGRIVGLARVRARRGRRRAAVVVLRALPVGWLLRVRAAHLADRPSALPSSWRRSLLRAARVRGIPQRTPFEVAGLPGIRIAPADSRIAAYLFWLGIDGHEPGEPAWWASLTASHSSVLELGANIGVYTLAGAAGAPAVPYRAVEANPTAVDALEANVALNRLPRVQVVGAAAVGTRDPGTVTLRFPASDVYGASSGAFVARSLPGDRPVASRRVSVPTVCIADLVAGVDLMKLDVEGLELELLQSIRSWIVDTAPTLVVEVLDDSRALQAFLADLVAEVSYLCVVVLDGRPAVVDRGAVARGGLQKRMGVRDVTLITRPRLQRVTHAADPGPGSRLRAMFDAEGQLH